jgi:peroxiredoxin
MKNFAKLLFLAATVAALSSINLLRAAAEVGQPAPDFTLTDITGKVHRLADYRGKVVVIEWTNPGCPIVQKHYNSHNMQDTQKAAAADGVVWLSINSAGYPGAQGNLSETEAAAWQKKMGATTTAYFRDQTGKVGHLYGATATPHMFVIKADGVLAYKGAIDSIPSADPSDIPNAKNYVKAALAAIKAGKPVEKSATQAYGCAIKYGSRDGE